MSSASSASSASIIYQIFLKAPNGLSVISRRSDAQGSEGWRYDETDDADLLLRSYIAADIESGSMKNWLAYNDEVAGENVSSSHGHCKGVLAWNDTELVWLVHSCPKYPETPQPTFRVPENALVYGQSFVCLRLPSSYLVPVIGHLRIMNAYVYAFEGNAKATYDEVATPSTEFDIIRFTDTVWHVAKGKAWNKDFYEQGLHWLFGGGEFVETWMRPRIADTPDIDNLDEIAWPNGLRYGSSHDHSKYGFSLSKDDPWVYVGDMNHQKSQAKRGGGGVVIINGPLWSAFRSLVYCESNE